MHFAAELIVAKDDRVFEGKVSLYIEASFICENSLGDFRESFEKVYKNGPLDLESLCVSDGKAVFFYII